ncbi:hypothetical protein PGTUg99_007561 [Puccinia graminis f. sp. tritici]|uniref:Uncharacterized protein n=1 Tax=Puccinia graminis f. sp. tritici TaxID=56615 RepID=A0A5B0S534_PUCGR|nr:hypothetical protein PGTUg99_007561 [Puccinia graminis f. sp. tritici]
MVVSTVQGQRAAQLPVARLQRPVCKSGTPKCCATDIPENHQKAGVPYLLISFTHSRVRLAAAITNCLFNL